MTVGSSTRVHSARELEQVFHAAEKPVTLHKIGAEAERFGLDASNGAPMGYSGPRGVVRVLEALAERFGWTPYSETPDGPVIALTRGRASITLEPGAQLELSGEPLPDIHAVVAETRQHLEEIAQVGEQLGLIWTALGFHPLARRDELPWVPKRRYPIMKEYLPTRGTRALDMMQRTATVQANFDYATERDAMDKLMLMLKLAPVFVAVTANSPYVEGHKSSYLSERAEVWRHMDPDRSGLIPKLWQKAEPSYADYIEWALDAPMFLIARGGQVVRNTGQPFRAFLEDGFEGERATLADFETHLNTLFPEARLKRTLEVRTCDCQSEPMAGAIAAWLTGMLYDDATRSEASALVADLDHDEAVRAMNEAAERGLRATLMGRPIAPLADRLVDLAQDGLERRCRLNAAGASEAVCLDPLRQVLTTGKTPAEQFLSRLPSEREPSWKDVAEAAHI